jgi:hypothetical protein
LPKKENFKSKVLLKLEQRFNHQKREIFTILQTYGFYRKNLMQTIVTKYFSPKNVGFALNIGFSKLKGWKNFCIVKRYKTDYEIQSKQNNGYDRNYQTLSLCKRDKLRNLRGKICIRAVYGWKHSMLAPAF